MPPPTFCSDCGARYGEGPFPKTCGTCGRTRWLNPLPVAVLLQPIGAGVLVVRRAIPPHVGKLALPGGFINLGESWQAAAARETREEVGLEVDAAGVRLFDVHSAPDGTVLIFGVAPPIATLPPLAANGEVSEVAVVTAPEPLAFDLHTRAIERFFRG